MHASFNYHSRESFANMTLEDAQRIQKYLYELEFPFTTQKALEFALFRTYAIPTISSLLAKTTQLSDPSLASKRVDDTRVIIMEMMGQELGSSRALGAIARMNYIHSLYQKSGLISNDDLLYTLTLFALEPIRWVARYEWREFSSMERCAVGVYWKNIGDAMKINFTVLPSGNAGWKDGLDFLAEAEAWSMSYEARCMVPAACNKQVADETTRLLLWRFPKHLLGLGRQAVSSLMDARLRDAMMYKKPYRIVSFAVMKSLWLRKHILRYLAFPRPEFLKFMPITKSERTGRMHKNSWDADPWYVNGSLINRWSLLAWVDWLSGRPIPGDLGGKFKPDGFLIGEVGPASMAGKGVSESEKDAELIKSQFGRGCPMAFGKT
ncbi:hypothetical protein AAFC00_005381 [Neodothiora populina]